MTRFLQRFSQQRIRQGLWQGVLLSLLLVLMWAGGLFSTARKSANNVYYLSKPTTDTIVIVAMDDTSLQTYGRSPVDWDRRLYAQAIAAINEGGARVVAFDVLFSEPTEQDITIADALVGARQGEYHPEGKRTRNVFPVSGTQILPLAADNQALNFASSLGTVPIIAATTDYLAYVNTFPDTDSAVRLQPSLIRVDGNFGVSFPIATLLAYSSIPEIAAEQLLVSQPDQLAITPDITPDRVLQVDENGFWRQNFFGTVPDTFTVVSFKDVIDGNVDLNIFDDKIVLVGLVDATGLTDQYEVPLGLNGRLMPGVEIHANAIETLLQNVPIWRLPETPQVALLVVLTLVCSVIYLQLRWSIMLVVAVVLVSIFAMVCFVLFDAFQLEVDLLYGALAILLPAFSSLTLNITSEIQRRQQVEFLLSSVVDVSGTRMSLDKIMPLVEKDIQSVAKASHGNLWLWEDEHYRLVHQWGSFAIEPQSPFFNQAKLNTHIQDRRVGLPIKWQNLLVGLLFLELDKPPNHQSIRLLEKLVTQLAPNLENAQLFSYTQKQNTLLNTILDAAPNAIITLNQSLVVQRYNRSTHQYFDMFDTRQVVGQPIDTVLQKADADPDQIERIRHAFTLNQPFQEEVRVGSNAYYFFAVPLPENAIWLVILNDVSTLSELNNLKTHMIRMASHDLKNPLTGILGYAEFLSEDPNLSPDNKVFVEYITKAANNMFSIITDILNLEQLQSGRIKREPLSLSALVKDVIEQHYGDALTHQHTIEESIDTSLPPMEADYRLLSQAVSNLVGNAIKYTPNGGNIHIRLQKREAVARLEVQDNGYGIPKDAQAKLFSQFYRVRTPATAHIKGTGLGLSLVKSIVTDHKGKVWVESEEGRGTTFIVELPLSDSSSS